MPYDLRTRRTVMRKNVINMETYCAQFTVNRYSLREVLIQGGELSEEGFYLLSVNYKIPTFVERFAKPDIGALAVKVGFVPHCSHLVTPKCCVPHERQLLGRRHVEFCQARMAGMGCSCRSTPRAERRPSLHFAQRSGVRDFQPFVMTSRRAVKVARFRS
ncbi:hypothetical protein GGR93_002670 [Sulfitobacter noctilucicola]|uniref:Uncharacterized protein n=1 Tax=Sulfitobacter noctilucicola TaxID=1342301 RepID=A0A7W6MA02_9RHOB|nr:hypothetical protein [Sulfitobacter noctilucicola]